MGKIRNTILSGLAALILGSTSTKAQLTPDQNTMALFHFDEGQGTTAYDSTQNGNDGELRNGAQWSEGFFNGGLLLDGISQYVTVQHDSTLNLVDFTIEARVKFDQGYNTDHRFIIAKRSPENGNYNLFYSIDNDGFLRVEFTDINLQSHVADYPFIPEVNRWYHIAGSFEGRFPTSFLNLWVDGSNVTRRPVSAAQPIFSHDLMNIGTGYYNPVPGHPFKGTIDEVRISNIARDFSTTSIPEQNPRDSTWGRVKRTFK